MSADHQEIAIVSGLPRSGTSLMMRMLAAGGLPVLTDGRRRADHDNPRGYYEFEAVKQTKADPSWLAGAGGKAVKMVSRLLPDLPLGYRYRVVFMRRDMGEILASQQTMLRRKGIPYDPSADAEMARLFAAHLAEIEQWLAAQENFAVIYLWYNELLSDPQRELRRLNEFFRHTLDTSRMAEIIDPALYRNRKSEPKP